MKNEIYLVQTDQQDYGSLPKLRSGHMVIIQYFRNFG